MKMRPGSLDAALQNMRYPQIISNLTEISFATVIHDTRSADDFQVADLGQLGQNVVLHAISKGRVLFLLAEVFKRQNGNSGCYWLPDKFTFPNDPGGGRCQSNQRCRQKRAARVAPHPFCASRENPSVSGL